MSCFVRMREVVVVVLMLSAWRVASAADASAILAARATISERDLKKHVSVLASDTFEGREAGSRGGRAVGAYLGKQLRELKFAGAGEEGSYFQEFGAGYRNILATIPGSDPELKNEVVVIGGHYDHVGLGDSSNSRGPLGLIHNGADDNASGTTALLEVAEALTKLPEGLRRTIVVAFWDAEEKGLLGSRHWVAHPTIAFERVKFLLNVDMVGRLRKNRLTVHGVRTGRGLRELVSRANGGLEPNLSFDWQIMPNTDHYPFHERRVPFLSLFTEKHEDYHTPYDDVEKLNLKGMQESTRLLFGILVALADAESLPKHRTESNSENRDTQRLVEIKPQPEPPRFGLYWEEDEDREAVGLLVTGVAQNTPAERAGIRKGDRLVEFGGTRIRSEDDLFPLVMTTPKEAVVAVRRPGREEPVKLQVALAGSPVRVGVQWRVDPAEPGCVILRQVLAGSPAGRSGLLVGDRVLSVRGKRVDSSETFYKWMTTFESPIEMEIEREGKVRRLTLDYLPSKRGDGPPAPPLPVE